MKKNLLIGIISICLLSGLAHPMMAERLFILKEIDKPSSLLIVQDRLYVAEKTSVAMYSLVAKCFIKKFGESGEGPSQFKITSPDGAIHLVCRHDKLWIKSDGKLSVYDLAGGFVREWIIDQMIIRILPVGNYYAIYRMAPGQDAKFYETIALLDEKFREKAILARKGPVDFAQKQIRVNEKHLEYTVVNDTVAISRQDDFVLELFDSAGRPIATVRHDIPPSKFTAADREKVIARFKKSNTWEMFKTRLSFPDRFPVIRELSAAGNTLAAVTYDLRDGKNLVIVLDGQGKIVQKAWVPLFHENDRPLPWTIHDGFLYQLEDNPDEETVVLHRFPLR